jgi:hypothetical protein
MQQSNIGMSAALQKGRGCCPIGNHALQHTRAWKRRRGVGSNMLSPAGSPRRQSCLIAYAPPSPFARRCFGRVHGNAGGLDGSPRITVTHYCNRPADSHVINGTAAAQLYKIAHCGAVTMDMLSRNHTAPARLSRFRVQMFSLRQNFPPKIVPTTGDANHFHDAAILQQQHDQEIKIRPH